MNVAKLMEQAQRMQAELQRALRELQVEGSAGGGLVKVTVNGVRELLAVSIDPQALAEGDPRLLEDLVLAAWEEASRRLQERSGEVLARFGLPPGVGGLF